MNKRRVIALIILATLALILISCDIDESKRNMHGGVLLDDELMSEIKDRILSTESDAASDTVDKADVSDDSSADSVCDESEKSLETVYSTEIVTENTEQVSDLSDTVFWLDGGSVWHISSTCHYLKDKDYNSGTITDAMNAGKTKLCSTCGK